MQLCVLTVIPLGDDAAGDTDMLMIGAGAVGEVVGRVETTSAPHWDFLL